MVRPADRGAPLQEYQAWSLLDVRANRREDFAACHMKALETFGRMADADRAYPPLAV
jgi:hypothetical protein